MGDGRQGTAHQPTHLSPPCRFKHTSEHRHTHAHTLVQTIEKEREQMRKVFVFFSGYYPFFLCSPCVFMSCHLVKRLYGLSRPHGYECGEVDCGSFRTPPGPALSASDRRASPESFISSVIWLPLLFLMFSFFFPISKYSTGIQNGKAKELQRQVTKSNIWA